MELLSHIELATGADPQGTVIWMHGLGADGWDFVPIVRELDLPEDLAAALHLPERARAPGHDQQRLRHAGVVRHRDGGHRAAARRGGHPPVAGAGRGAARAREVARHRGGPHRARGVLAGRGDRAAHGAAGTPSRWRASSPCPPTCPSARRSTANRRTPTTASRSSWRTARRTRSFPCRSRSPRARRSPRAALSPEWHTYPMPHSVCAEEVAAISQWLAARYASPILTA